MKSSLDKMNNRASRTVTTYQEAKLQHADVLRSSVVEAAAMLLQESGPEAVTVRRIAERMQCSTKIIYNLFGSKEGLAKQLFLDGCKLLSQALEEVPKQADPMQYLQSLANAYWNFGITYTSFYQMMFGGAFTEFKPDEESLQGTITALRQVIDLVEDAMHRGMITKNDPEGVVQMIWAPLHGVLHLYLGGHLGDEGSSKMLYDQLLAAVIGSIFNSSRTP